MSELKPRRARSIPEFLEFSQKIFVPEPDAPQHAPFIPQSDDIIITPYSKCGTTWLQQIFHTLRTGGDMDFDDISRVVPWIELAPLQGIDLNAPQRASPRGYKSHLPRDLVPAGARYVVALRDPKDAFVSMYHFIVGWYIEPGTVSMEQFYELWDNGTFGGGSTYWHHLLSWLEERDASDVLLLSYAGMTRDPMSNIRRFSAFCGFPLDDALLNIALDHSSLDFMKRHHDRFDDLLMRRLGERRVNLPPGGGAKVRKGLVGDHRGQLPAAVAAAIDARWAEKIAPFTGFASFSELDAALCRDLSGRDGRR